MIKSQKRTLIVDGQLFQSYTYHRGIGKYSLSLLEALNTKLSMYDNKVILFTESSEYLSDDDMRLIKKNTQGFKFEFLDFRNINEASAYEAVQRHNRGVVDNYIKNSHADELIDFMILSLFQENELPVFPTQCNYRYLVIFDLIPLLFFDAYLQVEHVTKNYLSRFDTLIEADHFFTISSSVASDLALHVGVPKERITPIYGAPIKRKFLDGLEIDAVKNKKIILLPSGDDYRKNNRLAVEAFEKFNKVAHDKYTLVITSAFTPTTRADLELRSKNIVFVGNVSESELAWLYDKAQLVFFPTQSEGLGLPILEAIEFGKRIVCSDIPVFREISSTLLNFCDPYKIDDMVSAIEKSLKVDLRSEDEQKEVLKKYDWGVSALLVSDTFTSNVFIKGNNQKKKVAVFSPKPSGFSGIGKVVQEQHYSLSRVADVTYFFEEGVSQSAQATEIRKNYVSYSAKCGDPWSFTQKDFDKYDQVMYHIGNGEYHVATLIKALAFPDQVILHDTRIKGLYGVARDVGAVSDNRYRAEEALNNMVNSENSNFLTSLVNKQNRVVTHSTYSQKAVKESLIEGKNDTSVINAGLAIPEPYSVNISESDRIIYVSMAGVMTAAKGIDLAHDITKIKISGFVFKVKIFGFSMLANDDVRNLQNNGNIELIQSPSDTRYLYELSQTDIMLNFRNPYHGETSYSTLEGLRFGKDVIINNTGWFSELPDNLIYKLNSSKKIIEAIKNIATHSSDNKTKLARIDFIAKEHNITNYVDTITDQGEDTRV